MVESETEAQWQKIIGLLELKLILNIIGTGSIVRPVPGRRLSHHTGGIMRNDPSLNAPSLQP